MQLESDKSVYFRGPFITAVKHHHALSVELELICGFSPLALISFSSQPYHLGL